MLCQLLHWSIHRYPSFEEMLVSCGCIWILIKDFATHWNRESNGNVYSDARIPHNECSAWFVLHEVARTQCRWQQLGSRLMLRNKSLFFSSCTALRSICTIEGNARFIISLLFAATDRRWTNVAVKCIFLDFVSAFCWSLFVPLLTAGKEGISTVAVKTLKENATEIERNDLYSELQVS